MKVSNVKDIIKQLFQLVLHPIKYIKSIDILMLDLKLLKWLMAILLLIGVTLIMFRDSVSPMLLVYIPLTTAIIYSLIMLQIFLASLFYTVIINFKKEHKESIDRTIVERVVTPFLLLSLLFNLLIGFISVFTPSVKYILNVGISIWYNVQIYLVFKYKFNDIKKGIISAGIGLILFAILSFYVKT